MIRKMTLTALLGLAALLAGCSSNAGAICDKRRECYKSDLDTGRCAQAVDDWKDAEDASARDARLETCAKCGEGITCNEFMERCIDDCLGIP